MPPMTTSDTIYALSTAAGVAGIAVVRISGNQAIAALTALCGRLPRSRMLCRRALRHPNSGEPLDDAMVVQFPGPASYTGEDVVELHIHGGRAVVAGVLAALGAQPGVRLAEAGEFTRRAFLNGRMDLTEAEGLADLLAAETAAQRRQALTQAGGQLHSQVEAWRDRLIEAMALTEVALDFSDEGDVDDGVLAEVPGRLGKLVEEMSSALNSASRAEIVRDGFRVVLAGPPNAGKSSLLNAMLKREAAIVSAEPGTTRDVIEARLDLDGLAVIVSDTAGLRAALGAVEQEGIRRTLAVAQGAHLVLWVIDQLDPVPEPDLGIRAQTVPVMPIVNKVDLGCLGRPLRGVDMDVLRVSARSGQGLSALLDRIAAAARAAAGTQEGLTVTRARQRDALVQARNAIASAASLYPRDLELRAEDLRHAAQALGRITGRVDVEDVLDHVFGAFCIGK